MEGAGRHSASDADLWIAYNLLEAGRLWKSRRYQTPGTLLLQRIGREEVADIPGPGLMLLPGKVGFVAEDRWRLNPSYLPPQLLARFAALNGPWRAMRQSISGCGWTLRRTALTGLGGVAGRCRLAAGYRQAERRQLRRHSGLSVGRHAGGRR